MHLHIRSTVVGLLLAVSPCLSNAQTQGLCDGKSMLEHVKATGVLTAGVKTETQNFGFIDEKGKNAGFEIDLISDIARRLGAKIKFVPAPNATRIQMLEQCRIDVLIATVSHYRSRNKVVDFSIGYLYTPQTLLVKKSSGIASTADLKDKRVASVTGSGAIKKIPAISPTTKIQTFGSWPDAFFALAQGDVDAVATDLTILQSLRVSSANPEDYVVLGKPGYYGGDYYAIAMRQNDSKSLNEINFLLQDQWLDGTWQKLFDKWLGKDSRMKLNRADFGDFHMVIWSN